MKIAVIGSGISGLGSAWLLRQEHDIVLYESGDHVGGHTHTHRFGQDDGSEVVVDSGFIVYNHHNYPLLTQLFDEIGITGRDTTMSFSVHDPDKDCYWQGHTLRSAFCQKKNLLRPKFWGMLHDIVLFNKHAELLLDCEPEISLGSILDRLNIGQWCIEDYILPMGSAIWSASHEQVRDMPAVFFARFLHNHGMLSLRNRPQWKTVEGGSCAYVERLLLDMPDVVRMDPVTKVIRHPEHIEVRSRDGADQFDRVIFACHADQVLKLLENPLAIEDKSLANFPYTANEAIIHNDDSILPPENCWAAWNYRVTGAEQQSATVTYHANILQHIEDNKQWLITLGDDSDIDPEKIIKRIQYHHPAFHPASIRSQQQVDQISGADRIHFCGAYWGYGFHEDGFASAVRVAKEFGVNWQATHLDTKLSA